MEFTDEEMKLIREEQARYQRERYRKNKKKILEDNKRYWLKRARERKAADAGEAKK